MARIRWPSEDFDMIPPRPMGDLISDDDRSVAADSWSIKSDYGSNLEDEQRHVDAAEVLSSCNFPAAPDYNSDKEVPDANEVETSVLGLQSYLDTNYSEDLTNFHEQAHPGEVWFNAEVMDVLVSWTTNLCANVCISQIGLGDSSSESQSSDASRSLSTCSVLDIGTGNGLLLQELAKQGFTDLTGIDFSEGAIELARNVAVRAGLPHINFAVDDILETKLQRSFKLIMDKGTLDAIGLHPDGPVKRMMYWNSVSNLVAADGGILVITSCNIARDDLLREVENFNERLRSQKNEHASENELATTFQYLDHVQSYPTVIHGGTEGSRVTTVAFIRK